MVYKRASESLRPEWQVLADKQHQWWRVWCGRSMISLLPFTWRLPGLLDVHDHAWLAGNTAHWAPAKNSASASITSQGTKSLSACVEKMETEIIGVYSLCFCLSFSPITHQIWATQSAIIPSLTHGLTVFTKTLLGKKKKTVSCRVAYFLRHTLLTPG